MRKTIYIILIAIAALVSCTKDYPLNREPIEDVLTVQANLHSADSSHLVYVHVSGINGIEDVGESAAVKCSVNGVGVSVGPHEIWGKTGVYEFEYDFEPGDKVRLDVEYEGMHAYSETVVPQRIEMELVDTVQRVEYYDYGDGTTGKSMELFLKVRIKDRPGEKTYFRLGDMRHLLRTYYWKKGDDGHLLPDPVVQDSWKIYSDRNGWELGSNPVLHDDYMVTDEDDLLSAINPTNYYRVFSDKLFVDSEVIVEFSFHEDWLNHFVWYSSVSETYSILTVSMEHIDYETYNYWKALNSEMMGSYGGLIMEPVIIPNNIVGGIGYFSISMDTSFDLLLRHYVNRVQVPLE